MCKSLIFTDTKYPWDEIGVPFSKSDWRHLTEIVEKHLNQRNNIELLKPNSERSYTYKLGRCVWNKGGKSKRFSAYINVILDDTLTRSGISIIQDEYVLIADWADNYNKTLFKDAFKEWKNWLHSKTETES